MLRKTTVTLTAITAIGAAGMSLTIPLISDQPVNISQKRLLENELGELLHKQP
jgi:hypothetical protein